MIYGGTSHGFYKDPKMPRFSQGRWQRIVEDFYNKYPKLKNWQDGNISSSLLSGDLVLPTGRRFRFSKIMGRAGILEYNERQIKNYPVQGLAGGDLLPFVCVIIRRGLRANGLLSKLILTVHDSLVFDVKHDELNRVARLCFLVIKQLPESISRYFGIDWNVALAGECEAGTNYGELKEITYEESLVTNEEIPLY
jgi:DNA polymerase-1